MVSLNLVYLGLYPQVNVVGVTLRMENCFKANSTMRALREATHTTNIDMASSQLGANSSSLGDIPESTASNAPSSFQPIFNWSKSQPTFLSRFSQPTTPGYPIFNQKRLILRTPTMQGLNPGSILSEESPSISTPLELMKQSQRPPSRSMVDTLKGKTTLRSVRESVQVCLCLTMSLIVLEKGRH